MTHEQKDTKKENVHIEIDRDKIWATVAYFFFPLPMILVKNRSNFLNYHINQGIILTIVSLAGQFGFGILPGWMGFIPGQVFNMIILAGLVMGILNVLKKEMKPLPLIGKLFSFIK
jgi:hypothetical protein